MVKNVENHWESIRTTLIQAATQEIGRMKTRYENEWWDEECKKIVEQKNEARKRWLRTNKEEEKIKYEKLRKECKKIIQARKNAWIEENMKEIETEAKYNNTKKFYKKIRQKTTQVIK